MNSLRHFNAVAISIGMSFAGAPLFAQGACTGAFAGTLQIEVGKTISSLPPSTSRVVIVNSDGSASPDSYEAVGDGVDSTTTRCR